MENISLKKVLAKLLSTKMVIESGTDGIWTYRKWSDGTCEAWGVTDSRSYAMTSTSGNGYYVASSQSLPSGLFAAVHTAFANRSSGNGLVFISINGLSTSQVNYFVSCTVSHTASFSIYLYVKGRWATFDPSSATLDVTGFSQQQMTKAEIRALIEGSGNIYKDNDTWIPSNLT